MNENESLYEVLGVTENATADEIKRAYFRLVRKFRPAENPDEFKRFTEAHAVLSDPARRSAYDQMRQHGDQVRLLTDEAGAILEEEPHRAIRLLKEAAVLAPDLVMPRFMLGNAYLRAEDFRAAEAEFRRLVGKDPDDAVFRYNLGGVLWLQDRLDEARTELNRAIEIDPHYHAALVMLARVDEEKGNIDQAVIALERAVLLDGVEDFADYEVFLKILRLTVLHERYSELPPLDRRMRAVIPDDEDAIHYAMASLHDLAIDFFNAGNFKGAHAVILRAAHPGLTDPKLIESIRRITESAGLRASAALASEDENIALPMRGFLWARYLASDEDADDTVRQNIYMNLQHECRTQPFRIRTTLDRLRQHYPAVASDSAEFLRDVEGMLVPPVVHQAVGRSTGGGCLLTLAAIAGGSGVLWSVLRWLA